MEQGYHDEGMIWKTELSCLLPFNSLEIPGLGNCVQLSTEANQLRRRWRRLKMNAKILLYTREKNRPLEKVLNIVK